MISQLASDAIDDLLKDGLSPSPSDIVRLNDLALACDEAKASRADQSLFLLPRIAVVGDRLTLRQPTIGHEIWLNSIERFVADDDYQTLLALRCFALSRPQRDLPDPSAVSTVAEAAAAFAADFADVTREVLQLALLYVICGQSAFSDDNDNPPREEGAATPSPDPNECVAIGVLRGAIPILTGLSLADLRDMTTREVQAAVNTAISLQGRASPKSAETEALGRFYDALADIKSLLRAAASMPPSTESGETGEASKSLSETSPKTNT